FSRDWSSDVCSSDLGTRTGVEDGQLAEHVRGPEDAEQVLPAVGGLAADLHLPGQDDVQLVTGLTLLEDDVAARELHALQRLRQRLRGGRLDALIGRAHV